MKENNGERYKLKKRRAYEIFPGRKFYLTNTIEFTIIQGTTKELEVYLEEIDMVHLKEYLYIKNSTLLDQINDFKNENNENDDSNLPLEFKSKPQLNTEDFNNFDYIPMDDEYINDELRKFKSEDEKILKEVLEAPNNLGEIINNTNNDKNFITEEEGFNINQGIHQQIDQMLTQRLTRKQSNQIKGKSHKK